MKKYDVVILPEAEIDMEECYLHIKKDSLQNASNWYKSLKKAILSLDKIPFRCPVAHEDIYFEEEIRNLIVGNYRAIYTIEADTVFVMKVKRCSQQWENINQDRD